MDVLMLLWFDDGRHEFFTLGFSALAGQYSSTFTSIGTS